ncbi:MAG TPA: RDD family protein [Candidatus Limnocylindria bacterium]|nr:RDD family protein [Candidatus Limnocylindria bacterium]
MATAAPAVTPTGDKIGFLTRTLAFIVDSILLAVVNGILTGVLFEGDLGRGQGLSTILGLAYYVYFWSSAGGGQTLGMKALAIKVVRTDGTALSVTSAIIRYVGLIVSFLCLFIGVIWVAFDANKQGWHDKIAGTYVVKA